MAGRANTVRYLLFIVISGYKYCLFRSVNVMLHFIVSVYHLREGVDTSHRRECVPRGVLYYSNDSLADRVFQVAWSLVV